MDLLEPLKNIFLILICLFIAYCGFTYGIYAIRNKYIQGQGSYGIWGTLDLILKTNKYIYYTGKTAVFLGILSIIISILWLFYPFRDYIVNFFKPGYTDSSGLRHIFVKPDTACGFKMVGGAMATCPNNYTCGPREVLEQTGTGFCIQDVSP